jgi:hypothetical protein
MPEILECSKCGKSFPPELKNQAKRHSVHESICSRGYFKAKIAELLSYKAPEQETIWADGTPYLSCGHCHLPITLQEGLARRIYIGYWGHRDVVGKFDPSIPGWPTLEKAMPKIHQAPGCFDCHRQQQDEKYRNPGKVVFFQQE